METSIITILDAAAAVAVIIGVILLAAFILNRKRSAKKDADFFNESAKLYLDVLRKMKAAEDERERMFRATLPEDKPTMEEINEGRMQS